MCAKKRKSRSFSVFSTMSNADKYVNMKTEMEQKPFKTMMMVNPNKRTRMDANAMDHCNRSFVRPNWKSRRNALPYFKKDNPIEREDDPVMLLEKSMRTAMCLKEISAPENLDEQAKPMDNSRNSGDIQNSDRQADPMEWQVDSDRQADPKYSPEEVVKEKKAFEKSRCCSNRFYMWTFILMLVFGVLSLLSSSTEIMHSKDYINASVELKKRVYGQPFVNDLTEYLLQDKPSLKVIALLGSTGVGKSYTVNIIKENFPRPHHITQFYPPIKETDAKFIFYPHLLVIENLQKRDVMDVIKFLQTFEKNINDRNVTVLTVFNFERIDEKGRRIKALNENVAMLETFFAHGHLDAKIIPYVSLDEEAIEKCIADVINHSGLKLSDKQINIVKQYQLLRNTGCKGAHSSILIRK